MSRREKGCPHGGRAVRECDACEVERLRGRVSELAIRTVVRDALKASGRG